MMSKNQRFQLVNTSPLTFGRAGLVAALFTAVTLLGSIPLSAQAREGSLDEIGVGYALPTFAGRSTEVNALSLDFGTLWSVAEKTRVGLNSHLVIGAQYGELFQDEVTGELTSLSVGPCNHWLIGVAFRQSFGDDDRGLYVRADAGVSITNFDGVGGGFLARAGYGIGFAEKNTISPHITFAGFAMPSGFNNSVEFGASFTY
jgi:hypothetical protein